MKFSLILDLNNWALVVVGSTNDYACYILFTIGNMIIIYNYAIAKIDI